MHTIQHLLHQYGYALIFGVIALECAGVILPGETVLLAASLFAAHGHLSILLVIACAATGAILGGLLGYALGLLLGHRILARHGWRIGLNARRLALGRFLFARHGGKVVFFCRFAAVLRSFSGILAGASDMRFRPYLAWCVAGGIAWPALYGYGTFLLGNAARRLSGPANIAFVSLAVIAILVVLVFARRNEERLTEEALRWERHG